jgi:hypothetical protein
MGRDLFEYVPNEIVEKIFALTDKSTYYTSRLVSKKFSLSISNPENKRKKYLVLKSAQNGNLNLLRLNMRYYGTTKEIVFLSGISGNQEVINFCLNKFPTNDGIQNILSAALQYDQKNTVFWCLEKNGTKDYSWLNWHFSRFICRNIDHLLQIEVLYIFSKIVPGFNVDLISTLLHKFGFSLIHRILSPQNDKDRLVCAACWKLESMEMFEHALLHGYEVYINNILYVRSKQFAKNLHGIG